MSGIKALRRIQLGREATAGTIVAATTKWRGTGTIEDMRTMEFPAEDVGILPGTTRSYVPKLLAGLHIDQVPATFEQVGHIFEMAIAGSTGGVQDGSGPYVYTYPFPSTAGNTVNSYTIEGGDNQEAEVMEYGHILNFNMSGTAGEAWMVDADIRGRQVALQAFTSSTAATLPTVEECLVSKTKVYIDSSTGAYGGTQVSNTVLSASLKYITGLKAKYTADGNLYFSFLQTTPPEAEIAITFEHDATSAAEKVNWRAQTPRLIQLKCEGSTVAIAGSTYSRKTLIVNAAGKWSKFAKIGERDGNDILEGTFKVAYDETAAKYGNIILVNSLVALP